MKIKKGFTLIELLAVIAILSILVLIALPNVIRIYKEAKKQVFLTEARTVYREALRKFIDESDEGELITNISSDGNKLELEGNKIDYNIQLNEDGEITYFKAYNDNYCINGEFKNVEDLVIEKVIEGQCEPDPEPEPEIGPKSFATDPWEIIIKAVRENNTSVYHIGDTRKINLGEEYGNHTLRLVNKSESDECKQDGFSQSACGFVIEFADVIDIHKINSLSNNDGWPGSDIRKFILNNIYDTLEEELKNIIIETKTISGHGLLDKSNFEIDDKLYLLAPKEIYGDWSNKYDTAKDFTRQLDYYKNMGVNTNNTKAAIKKKGTLYSSYWLRTAYKGNSLNFFTVNSNGVCNNINVGNSNGVVVAFRIG